MTGIVIPRCIADFVATPAAAPEADLGDIDGENRYFALGCPCAGEAFVVRSHFGPHYYLPHETARGPIALQCTTCGVERVCFDPAKHGYDAEIDHFPPSPPYRGEEKAFTCPGCGKPVFGVVARFEYQYDPLPDMFSYFMLVARCTSCSWIGAVADVECV